MTKQAFLALLLVVSILEPALGQSPQPSQAPAVPTPSVQTQTPPTPQPTPPSDKEDTVRITTKLSITCLGT